MKYPHLGYKVPFRQCYTPTVFGKWGIIHYTLYCHVWLKLFRPSLPRLVAFVAFLLLCSCAKDPAGHYAYYGPSVGISGGYQGIAVGFTLYGQNPATPVVAHVTVDATPTPSPSTVHDGP